MMLIVEEMMRSQDNNASVEKAVDRVVALEGQFDGRNITKFLDAYRREMNQRDVSEARQISSFKRVVSNNIQRRVIELQEGKTTWSEFEKATLAEFAREDLSRMTRHVLMKWIEKKNKKMSASRVFDEFDQMFDRLPTKDQVLLEEDKSLYFLKAVDMKDRRELGILLEDDTQANGLVADWAAVKRACNKIDRRRQWLDGIDLVRTSVGKTNPSKEVKTPKENILHEKKIDNIKATSREDECFETCVVFETTDDEGASLIKACVKGDEECEVDVVEVVAMRNDIESKMAMHESTADDHVKTFPTLDLETSAVAPKCQRETGETESDGEAKIEADANNNVEGKMSKDESTVTDGAEVLPTIVPETSAVAPKCQRETGETEGGGKKSKDRNGEEEDDYRRRNPSTPVPKTSAVVPESQHKSGEMEGGGEEMRVEANTYGETVANKEAKNKATIEFDEEPESGKKGKTGIQSGWKMTRLVFRPEWKPTRTRVDQPGPTQLKPGRKLTRMKVDHLNPIRPNANPDEGRPSQKLIGRDRSRQKLIRPRWRSKQMSRDTRSRLLSIRKGKRETRKDNKGKLGDQGDGRDEGGTCTRHEPLCSEGAKRAMTTRHGNEKSERMIWWIGWQ